MRRTGNLYDRIVDEDNLRLAFYRAARGKRLRPDVLAFECDIDSALRALQAELRLGEVAVGDYRYFTVWEPKERLICAASFRERVLHHAVINVLDPVLERFQIDDSYACRVGKGTEAALLRSLACCRSHAWFLKLDVRRYFDSIPHETLLRLLARKVKDRRLLALVGAIVDSYERLPGRGLPIGNLTSQHLANFYLAHVDHLVKDHLRVRGYIRYMDDMLIFGESSAALAAVERQVRSYIGDDLQLQLKPVVKGRAAGGVPFLGFRVYPGGIHLSRRKRRLAGARVRHAALMHHSGVWTDHEYAAHVLPVFAHLELARSRRFRHSLIQRWDHGMVREAQER